MAYAEGVGGLAGAEPLNHNAIQGVRLAPDAAAASAIEIRDRLSALLDQIANTPAAPAAS